jgi:hypothetical protein
MNSSIYAIFLSAILVFSLIFYTLLWNKNSFLLLLNVVIALIALVLIYVTFQGRAASIGAYISIVYLLAKANLISKRILLTSSLCVLLVLLVLSFSIIKKDSSNGRLLIYKVVSTELNPKDFVAGLGIGKFKATYNKLQAAYFEKHDRNSKEALLAGNGYYLFNDWLQFTLEVGVIGVLLIAALVFSLFKFFYWKPNNKPVLIAANATLLCIGTAAFFSYPLQVPATLYFFIFCLSIHLYYSWSIKERYNNITFRLLLRIVAVSIFLMFFSFSAILYSYNKQSNVAFELTRDGFKKEAEQLFRTLNKYPVDNYNTRYNYAYLLYFKNDLQNALLQIDKSLNLAYSATSVKLKADILAELSKYSEAEYYYKQAVYITPGRMIPKLNLVEFYIKTNQIENINYWANDIINMPIKILSETTERIQNQAKEILKKYSK